MTFEETKALPLRTEFRLIPRYATIGPTYRFNALKCLEWYNPRSDSWEIITDEQIDSLDFSQSRFVLREARSKGL